MSELRTWLGQIAIWGTALPPALWVAIKLGEWLFWVGTSAPLIAAFVVGVISGLGWLVLTIVEIERERLNRRRGRSGDRR